MQGTDTTDLQLHNKRETAWDKHAHYKLDYLSFQSSLHAKKPG